MFSGRKRQLVFFSRLHYCARGVKNYERIIEMNDAHGRFRGIDCFNKLGLEMSRRDITFRRRLKDAWL